MVTESRLRIARGLFVIVIGLGCIVAVIGVAWLSAVAAASIDQVLSPEELRDSKLVDIVYRTHERIDAGILTPYLFGGAATALCGIFGLLALRNAAT